MEAKNVRVKLLKSNDLNELEELVNNCIERQIQDNFVYDSIDLLFVDTFIIATLVFKYSNLKFHLSNNNHQFQVKVLSEKTISKLEKKVNSLIQAMQNQSFFMNEIELRKDSKRNFVAVVSFEYCCTYISHF